MFRGFADHGFAVVPSVLNEKALASAREAVGIIERSVGDLHPDIVSQLFVLETATPATESTDPPREVLFIASDPPRFHPELVEVLTDPFLIELTQVLLGVEEIQYHFANITTKVPGLGRAVSWHRDYPNQYICPRRSSFLRVTVCLDGMDGDNGGTQFVSGSHVLSERKPPPSSGIRAGPQIQKLWLQTVRPARWCSSMPRSFMAALAICRSGRDATSSRSGVGPMSPSASTGSRRR